MLSALGASSNNSEAISCGHVAWVRHSVLWLRLAKSTEWQTQATGSAQFLVLYYGAVVQVINGQPGASIKWGQGRWEIAPPDFVRIEGTAGQLPPSFRKLLTPLPSC